MIVNILSYRSEQVQMSDRIAVGSLVKFAKSSWLYRKGKNNLGLVIKGPEAFGFNDRYLVHWISDVDINPSWVDMYELEIVNESR